MTTPALKEKTQPVVYLEDHAMSPERIKAVEQLYSGRPSDKGFLCARCEQALGKIGAVQALMEASWHKLRRPPREKTSRGRAFVQAKHGLKVKN